ncbi:MAG: glycosyltransferase family 2 protein [Pseudomonadota bacterium]
MTLAVRDGADLVRQNMNFHLARGIDHVVAIDNGSVDGTRDILGDYEKLGVATVIDEPSRKLDIATWVTNAAKLARDRLGADWVLCNDIDEFWMCPSGTIKDRLASTDADVLVCQRKNMVYAYDEEEETHFYERMIYRIDRPLPVPVLNNFYEDPLPAPYFYLALPPKILVKTQGLSSVAMGNHSATFDQKAKQVPSDIIVYHFPVRSVAQFEQKVVHGGEARERDKSLPKSTSWHWRRWYRLFREHGPGVAIADALPSAQRLARDIASGVVVEDRSLVEPLTSASKSGQA